MYIISNKGLTSKHNRSYTGLLIKKFSYPESHYTIPLNKPDVYTIITTESHLKANIQGCRKQNLARVEQLRIIYS